MAAPCGGLCFQCKFQKYSFSSLWLFFFFLNAEMGSGAFCTGRPFMDSGKSMLSCRSHACLSHIEQDKHKACQQYLPFLHLYPSRANLALQHALVHRVAQVNPLFLLFQDHPVENHPSELIRILQTIPISDLSLGLKDMDFSLAFSSGFLLVS